MKKNIIAATILALASLTACDDFLTEAPVLSQSDELTLSTIKGLNKAVAGAYAPLASNSWYSGDFLYINEMKTGNGIKHFGSDYDTGRMDEWYQLNYTPTYTSGIWSLGYYVVKMVNDVMDNLDGKADKATLNNLKAECLFLRAFAHFDLVRTFATPYGFTSDGSQLGVPVVLHTDPTGFPARNTVKEVYDQIVADLLEAESIIDPEYKRDGNDSKAVVGIDAIRAFLCRVYLYMGEYQKCADYATKVIDSGNYTMWTAEDLEDAACYTEDCPKSGEIIFEVYSKTTNGYGGGNESICYLTSPDGYGDACVPESRLDIFADGDVRGDLFQYDEKTGFYWTAKYLGKGDATPDYNNIIIFRLSEMYLNRAEALQNGAVVEGASVATDVNTVASNRGAVAGSGLAGILAEREKEFNWEAQNWFDYGRINRCMERTDQGDKVLNKVESSDKRWAMPIPEREILVNENLKQNTGY